MSIVKNGNALDHTVTAFEADLMVDLNSEGYSYQIFFSDTPLGNRAYLLQIEHRAGKVILTDNSNSNNNAGKNQKLYDSLNAGEWFNLRVEYYKSTMAKDLRVKVFVNGELIAVSDNFYGSESPTVVPGSLINCVTFYSLNSTDGFVYMDNLRFYDFDGICTDDVKK